MARVGPVQVTFAERIRKGSLYSLIAFFSITAALAIITVLFHAWGDLEIRVLLTTLTITLASICCLCCGAYIQATGHRYLGLFGIVLAAVASVLIFGTIWFDLDTDVYLKAVAVASICAVACAHAFALWIARLKPRHRWVQVMAALTIYTLAACLCLMTIFEHFDEFSWRGIAALSILAALETLVVPILRKVGKTESEVSPETITLTREPDGYFSDERGRLFEVRELGVESGKSKEEREQ